MRLFALCIIILTLSNNALACPKPDNKRSIICSIDLWDEDDTPVTFKPYEIGNWVKPDDTSQKTIEFENMKFQAIWHRGSFKECQTSLRMQFDDLKSVMYDIDAKPWIGTINVMSKDNIRFQCGFE